MDEMRVNFFTELIMGVDRMISGRAMDAFPEVLQFFLAHLDQMDSLDQVSRMLVEVVQELIADLRVVEFREIADQKIDGFELMG
jgi:hypothetical protein